MPAKHRRSGCMHYIPKMLAATRRQKPKPQCRQEGYLAIMIRIDKNISSQQNPGPKIILERREKSLQTSPKGDVYVKSVFNPFNIDRPPLLQMPFTRWSTSLALSQLRQAISRNRRQKENVGCKHKLPTHDYPTKTRKLS